VVSSVGGCVHERMRSRSGRCRHGGLRVDGHRGGHDVDGEFVAMPGALVVGSGHQCVHTPAASAAGNVGATHTSPAVVHPPAPVGTSVGPGVGATTAADPAVGAKRQSPGVGSRPSPVGYLDRPGLGPGVERV
jgi:hypothetical protein